MVIISAAVEGLVDEAVVKRIVRESGGIAGRVYGKNGKAWLRARINGYNNAARHQPWVVLVDLDQDAECGPNLSRAWLPGKSSNLCFRVAVHEVEAWILADRDQIASFLSVPVSRIPTNPEFDVDAKRSLVNLAASSRRRAIREDMVPRPGSGREVGPAYTSRLIEFVSDRTKWRPRVAAQLAPSLRSCMECIERLIG